MKTYSRLVPHYHGRKFIDVELPTQAQPWLRGKRCSLQQRRGSHGRTARELAELIERYHWRWPSRPVYFFSDLHADTDALAASLVASGGVSKTGRNADQLKLTSAGRKAHFLIGGDCFDKGPSNLAVLRMLDVLHQRGARLKILAGNHDIRVMLGMSGVGNQSKPGCEHFFARMGAKSVPFLKEICDSYLTHRHSLKHIPGDRRCREQLFPPESWYERFPRLAADLLPQKTIERELRRIPVKQQDFVNLCEREGLSMRQAYAAALQWQRLFLHDDGEFGWYFRRMKLLLRKGSFLFVHAGLDNNFAYMVDRKGIGFLNRCFLGSARADPLRFYYGPIANAFRTKYRPADRPLSARGAKLVHDHGLHVIVHGHKNLLNGQRITLRRSLVHIECDITMDRHSREREGLQGNGAGVTIIHPDKKIIGISTDYPYVKIFAPADAGE